MSNRAPVTTEDTAGGPCPLTPGLIVPGVPPYYDIAPGVVVPAAHAPSHAVGGSDPVIGPLALQAGSAVAGTAPLKLASGPLLTVPEVGAVEFLTDQPHMTITTGAARKPIVLADAALTSGRIPFTANNGRLADSADLTRNPTTGDITLGNGANLELSGANALGEGNIVLKAAASAAFDTNLVITNSTANTMGYICGSTPGFVGANGPFFGLRGNTYAAYANQRGNIFLYGGKPAAPGALEGRVILGTNDTERFQITYGGDVKVATGSLYVNQGWFVLPKTSGYGILVDTAAPTFPWKNIIGLIEVKGTGANDPDWVVFRDTIYQYRWTNGNMRQVWNIFPIPMDYMPGTDVWINVHWDQNVVDTGGPAGVPGVVKWYLDVSYAKGYGTPGGAADAFNAIITTSVTQQGSTTQYGHMTAGVQLTNAGGSASHIDRARLEPNGIFKVRLYRDSGDAADTLNEHPFVGMITVQHQSTGIGTKQRVPPFYT